MANVPIYRYVPHRRTKAKMEGAAAPVKVVDQMPHGNRPARFNQWFAVKITAGVGTMWCAYAFAALAFVSLPSTWSARQARPASAGIVPVNSWWRKSAQVS